MKGVFVTGTDTGVGKTLFAAAQLPPLSAEPALVHHSRGVDVEIHWRHAV